MTKSPFLLDGDVAVVTGAGSAIVVRTDVTLDDDVERVMQAAIDKWARLDIRSQSDI